MGGAAQQGAPDKTKAAVFVESVPKSAKEVRPDVFRLEEAGKLIIYIRTPFGVTRMEQSEEMRKVIEDGPPMGISARETADQYIFERMTPFGRAEWKKKKGSQEKLDLLTSDEVAALAYRRQLMDKARTAKPPAEKGSKP
jgi:hypothetical protein